jgi:hypothetical protein
MRIRAARGHVLHANSTLVDRIDLATPLSLPSLDRLPALSALAPAQRAGAQRLCAMAQSRSAVPSDTCLLLRAERTQAEVIHGRKPVDLWRISARCRSRFRLMPMERSHRADPGEHSWPVMFGDQQ